MRSLKLKSNKGKNIDSINSVLDLFNVLFGTKKGSKVKDVDVLNGDGVRYTSWIIKIIYVY